MITAAKYKKINNVSSYSKAEKKLVNWLHKYIRLRDIKRDENNNLIGHCISCGKQWEVILFSDGSIMNGKSWHAGHFFLSNKYQSVRFDEKNISTQCYYCNKSLSGNLANYQINLIKKIGQGEFDLLVERKNQIKHYSILELEELTERYKIKVKEELRRLGLK